MRRRLVRNLALVLFMVAGLASLHASYDPGQLCQRWSCGSCNFTTEYDCDASGGPPFVYAYQFSGCDLDNQEMCGDNELTCMLWCTSYQFEQQVDNCLTPGRQCHIGYPASSACDEFAGTMDCQCAWFNMYCGS